jgi:hypothetical protein
VRGSKYFSVALAVALAYLMLPGAAQAVTCTGNLSGTTCTLNGSAIKYEYDINTNAAALALFGAPDIQGDVVRFLPPSFRAESIDGVGTTTGLNSDVVSANFIFDRVYSTNQKALSQVQIIEFGDYEIDNGDSAEVDLLLSMSNNNNFLEFTSASAAFDAAGDSGGLQTWQIQAALSPEAEFSAVANDVAITIQNTLTATTNAAGETAWIQKKISLVATTETVVPLPAGIWLMLSGLGVLASMRRRRSA